MGAEHVIAIIAALLQVRNAIVVSAEPSPAKREALAASLGDPIEEARDLIKQVISDNPKLPEARNVMARGGQAVEE